jgi:hypothetical protein
VEESSDARIAALLQERGPTKAFARITVNVAADAPDGIAGISLQPTPPPPELAPQSRTAAEFPVRRMSENEVVAALRAKLEKDAAADRFAGTVLLARIDSGGGRGADRADARPTPKVGIHRGGAVEPGSAGGHTGLVVYRPHAAEVAH